MVNKFILVKNEPKYYEFIRNLRNDERLLDGFIDKTYITESMQNKYMQNHSQDYYICLEGDTAVGFIGVVDNDLRLAVDYKNQRKGIASFMVQELLKIIPNFEVRVLPDNVASIKMFKRNGFKEIGKEIKSGVEVLRFSL